MKNPIFFDTSCFIYLIEKSSDYFDITRSLFDDVSTGKIKAVSSIITLSETLVKPLREKNDWIINEYKDLFNELPNFQLTKAEYSTAIKAAEIRAESNVLLPDAYQLAMAIESGCKTFLTNDENLKKIKEIKVVCLSNLT